MYVLCKSCKKHLIRTVNTKVFKRLQLAVFFEAQELRSRLPELCYETFWAESTDSTSRVTVRIVAAG